MKLKITDLRLQPLSGANELERHQTCGELVCQERWRHQLSHFDITHPNHNQMSYAEDWRSALSTYPAHSPLETVGVHFTNDFSINSVSVKWLLWFCPYLNKVISTKFGTWHNSCAVMSCAKICGDLVSRNGITEKYIFHGIKFTSNGMGLQAVQRYHTHL